MTPEAGKAIEMLGHAIEYLADEYALECTSSEDHLAGRVDARVAAIELLMQRNREIYYSCPVEISFGERLRSMLRLQQV